MKNDIFFLKQKSIEIRKKVWQLIYKHQTGHTSSDFSCTDILVALYYDALKQTPETFQTKDADTYIQSKGHAAEVYFEILADRGYFNPQELDNFSKFKSHYIGHPTNDINGVELNTGSLGHGLGLGVGIALAAKLDNLSKKVFVLMGDGEQAEGSIWEAAMAAGNYQLNNLVAIVDHNNLQITGPTDKVMHSNPLKEKYQAFGWNVIEIDGHNFYELTSALNESNTTTKPRMIIANTIKGKGISFMEDIASWHHGIPNEEQYLQGLKELDMQLEELQNGKK